MDLVYDEKTGTWDEKKEPYITIEVETKKACNYCNYKKQCQKDG